MPTEITSTADPALEVVPPIICNQPDDVADVQAIGDGRIHVRFNDGVSGVVDLSRMIASPDAGVFRELRDRDVFLRVGVRLGAVTWPGDIDLAPDAMYIALRENGEWMLD